MDKIFANIIKRGTFYNPAYKHYGHSTNVVCDRCFKRNISKCIGWEEYDLCLPCANTIDDLEKINGDNEEKEEKELEEPYPEILTLMMQNQFDSPKTRMMQNQFDFPKPDDKPKEEKEPEILTFMMQNQFNPPKPNNKPKTRMMQNQFESTSKMMQYSLYGPGTGY